MLEPGALVDGQEALEGEPACGEAGQGQGGDHGAGAGYHQHGDAVLRAEPDQILAGVGDGRHPGVRHQGAALARQEPAQDDGAALGLVVLIVAHQRALKAQVGQQLQGNAGVLRRHKIRLFQGLHGPGRDVAQVADGRSHNIKNACHCVSSMR